jgi:FKBP-type peptidyl-prolyl cis-trans isomerase
MLALFSACGTGNYKSTKTGLQYRIIRDAKGKKAQLHDVLQLNLSYHLPDDSVLYDSEVLGDSFLLKITEPSFPGSIEEGLLMLGEGDSAEFLLPADSVYKRLFRQRMPAFIQPGTLLTFRVGVVNVMDETAFQRRMQKERSEGFLREQKEIEKYLQENNLNISAVSPGIWFIMLQEGKGKRPATGDSVEVKYTGRLLNGKIFDSSSKAGRNLRYRIGNGNYLKAWEQAIMSMPEGSMSRLILSSDQAFGRSASAPVPPGSPVIFDIELIKVFEN